MAIRRSITLAVTRKVATHRIVPDCAPSVSVTGRTIDFAIERSDGRMLRRQDGDRLTGALRTMSPA